MLGIVRYWMLFTFETDKTVAIYFTDQFPRFAMQDHAMNPVQLDPE
jgi:hypothetical protein